MSSTVYTTTLIPKTLNQPNVTALARKFRTFKLHALQSDPKAFSQEYSTESGLPLAKWESRITNPGSQIVVCMASSGTTQSIPATEDDEAQLSVLLHSEWAVEKG